MFLSDASVRRPVAMTCLIIALSLLGLRAYRDMSLEWLPQIDIPYITVLTVYPGGTPAEIETDIGKRIEDVIVSVEGIKHVTTSCMENACQILLEFQLGVDVDVAANDVREKIDMVVNDFPSGVEKPTVLKFDINAIPIISLALTGDAPIDALYDYADNELKDRLTTTEGVATTEIVGGSPREVQVRLDRDALAARGLSSTDVVRAVQEGVGKVPAGRIHDDAMEYAVTFDAEYAAPEALEALEIANADGARCHIGDVGRVVMAPGEETSGGVYRWTARYQRENREAARRQCRARCGPGAGGGERNAAATSRGHGIGLGQRRRTIHPRLGSRHTNQHLARHFADRPHSLLLPLQLPLDHYRRRNHAHHDSHRSLFHGIDRLHAQCLHPVGDRAVGRYPDHQLDCGAREHCQTAGRMRGSARGGPHWLEASGGSRGGERGNQLGRSLPGGHYGKYGGAFLCSVRLDHGYHDGGVPVCVVHTYPPPLRGCSLRPRSPDAARCWLL